MHVLLRLIKKRFSDLVISLFDFLLCGSTGDTQDFIEVFLVCKSTAGVERMTGNDMRTSHPCRENDTNSTF